MQTGLGVRLLTGNDYTYLSGSTLDPNSPLTDSFDIIFSIYRVGSGHLPW